MLEVGKPEKKKPRDFAFECLMNIIESTNARNVMISAEETNKIVEDKKFEPTMTPPDVVFEKEVKYSAWLKPVFYYYSDELKTIIPEIVIVKGAESLYSIDETTKRMMETYEFLTNETANELSTRILSRKNSIHLLVFARREFKKKDLNEIKQASFFLNPNKLLVISESYLPDVIKANLPIGAVVVENLGVNKNKLKEKTSAFF